MTTTSPVPALRGNHPTRDADTGYADRGPEPGLVHLAVARPDRPTAHRVQRLGTLGRGAVRLGTLHAAITLLEEHL